MVQPFHEKTILLQKMSKNDLLWDPRNPPKDKKTEEGTSRNRAEKNTQNKHSKWTCLSNGTGSAFKRRARAKWIPERFLHFMWSSAAPAARPRPPKLKKLKTPPRTKTRKHHRTIARTALKVTPKWPQNGTKSGPRTIPETLRKEIRERKTNSVILGHQKSSEMTPEMTLKS